MLKFIATKVGVSKGFNGNPAVFFSDNGNFVRFRIGSKVFDKTADKNTRWVNIMVKGFGETLCERIRKMELKEGSMINLIGRYDEDTWEDKDTKEKRSMPVVILEDLEFCGGGGKKSDNGQPHQSGNAGNPGGHTGNPNGYSGNPYGTGQSYPNGQNYGDPNMPPAETAMPGNFSGYEAFSGGGDFF